MDIVWTQGGHRVDTGGTQSGHRVDIGWTPRTLSTMREEDTGYRVDTGWTRGREERDQG